MPAQPDTAVPAQHADICALGGTAPLPMGVLGCKAKALALRRGSKGTAGKQCGHWMPLHATAGDCSAGAALLCCNWVVQLYYFLVVQLYHFQALACSPTSTPTQCCSQRKNTHTSSDNERCSYHKTEGGDSAGGGEFEAGSLISFRERGTWHQTVTHMCE